VRIEAILGELRSRKVTISRRNCLAELYKCLALHPIIPPVEIIYSPDSAVYYFDPAASSAAYAAQFSLVREYGKVILLVLFYLTWRSVNPLKNIGERCRDSTAIHAFSHNRNYIIKTVFVPSVYRVATEELEKACARVQLQ
jgi:hypothetical protein